MSLFHFNEANIPNPGKYPSPLQISSTGKYSTVTVAASFGATSAAAKKEPITTPPAPNKTPAGAAPTKAAVPASNANVAELEKEIAAQGVLVKQLKDGKASEELVKAAVEKLLELKNGLPEGHALRPISRSDQKKKEKAAAAKEGDEPPVSKPSSGGAADQQDSLKDEKRKRLEEKNQINDKEKMKSLLALAPSPNYGVMPLVRSRPADKSNKKWTLVGDLATCAPGTTVLVRGYAHAIKSASSATFLVVRQRMHTIQAVVDSKSQADIKAFVDMIPVESVVDVLGVVAEAEVKATTVKSREIKLVSCHVVQIARINLPFQPREVGF